MGRPKRSGCRAPRRSRRSRPSRSAPLHEQTRGVAIRTGLVAGIVLLVLAVLAAYVAVVTRRAIELRERLRSAERVAHLSEMADKIFDAVPVGVFTLSD